MPAPRRARALAIAEDEQHTNHHTAHRRRVSAEPAAA